MTQTKKTFTHCCPCKSPVSVGVSSAIMRGILNNHMYSGPEVLQERLALEHNRNMIETSESNTCKSYPALH